MNQSSILRRSADNKPSGMKKVNTKSQLIINALRRKRGASLGELCKLVGWQNHSMRGYLSGTLRKKQKLNIQVFVTKAGKRRYHLASEAEV